MTAAELRGLRVLVTRPQAQAKSLAGKIHDHGGTPVLAPCIEVVGLKPSTGLINAVQHCGNCDAVIFISANAVNHANSLCQLRTLSLQAVFAPGKATASELQSVGVDNVSIPDSGYDSEALLALPAFKNVNNKRIAIIRGCGGRDLLRDKLAGRGAIVEYVDVYRRQRPDNCCENLRIALADKLNVVLASSGEVLENLLSCLSDKESKALFSLPLFAPSERVARLAEARGFNQTLITESPDDAGVVNSLLKWATGREVVESNER